MGNADSNFRLLWHSRATPKLLYCLMKRKVSVPDIPMSKRADNCFMVLCVLRKPKVV